MFWLLQNELKRKKNPMCAWVVAQFPQRLKSTFFEIFSSLQVTFFRDPPFKKIFIKTLILALEANKMDFFL